MLSYVYEKLRLKIIILLLAVLFYTPTAYCQVSAEEYFHQAVEKDRSKDYQGAIADYNVAIEINPNYAQAYNNKGIIKYKLKDYQGPDQGTQEGLTPSVKT